MRTSLEHGVFPARVANFGEESLQVQRLWSCVRRDVLAKWRVICNRAKQTGFCSRSAKNRINQRSGRGLSICSGYCDQLQCFGGTAEEIRSRDSKAFAAFSNLDPHDVGRKIGRWLGFARDRDGSALYGVPHVPVAV